MNPSAEALQMFADFGVSATLNSVAVRGIFDNTSTEALGGMMLGTNPQFTCVSSSAGSDARGKSLVIDGITYTVREVKPDGTGFTLLELEKA